MPSYRQAQLALRRATVSDLLKLWPAFDINRIKKTWPPFEEAALLLVQNRARTSAGLASAFYRQTRREAGISGLFAPQLVLPETDAVVTGLRIVGQFNALKQLSLGRLPADVAAKTLVNLSGETTRHVLNSGRKTVVETTKSDPQARGWQRDIGPGACDFCEMLANRGAVYSESTADFQAHKHCACVAMPAF